MFEETELIVDDFRWNVAVGPQSGPPLVLFHGVTRRWQCFLPILPRLAARWQVFAVDAPGHSGSDRLPRYRVTDYIEASVKLVRQQSRTPVAIYGHSLGSMVAAGVAAECPSLVSAIVLEDPPFETMGRRIGESPLLGYFRQLRGLLDERRSLPELVAALSDVQMVDPHTGRSQMMRELRDAVSLRFGADCLAHTDPKVLDGIIDGRWLEGFDWLATCRRIECPALILQADPSAGGMLTDADAHAAREAIRDATLLRLAGVGHQAHWLNSTVVADATVGFLETIPRGPDGRDRRNAS